MAETLRFGPATILTATAIGDPVEAWTEVGSSRGDTKVTPKVGIATGALDQSAGTPLAAAVFKTGDNFMVVSPLVNRDIAVLAKLAPGSVIVTASGKTSLGFGSGTARIAARAFAIVPTDEYVSGAAWWDSASTIWISDGVAVVTGDFTSDLPDEGDDALSSSVYEVTITSMAALGQFSSAVRSGAMGPIWLRGRNPLGLDLLWEAFVDTGVTPLVGGAPTFARSSTATYVDRVTGKLNVAAINTPRFESKGLLIEPQATLKTQRNVLHAAAITGWTKSGDAACTLTAVTDAAELAAAGLDLIVTDNYVLKLDNTAGSTAGIAISTGTTNANPHTYSAWVRGGTGSLRDGATSAVAFAAQATYRRVSGTIAAPSGANTFRVYADAGQVVYFVLGSAVELPFATSDIPNSTAGSVTRAADSLTVPYTTDVSTYGTTAQVLLAPLFADAVTQVACPLAIGSGPRMLVRHNGASGYEMITEGAAASVSTGALFGDAFAAGVAAELTFSFNANGSGKKWAVYQGDTDVTPVSSSGSTAFTQWGGGLVYIGGSSLGNTWAGHIQRVAVARGVRLPSEMRQLKRS